MSTQWKTGSGSFNGLSVESAQFILDIGKFCNWISFFLADGQHLSFWHTCFWLFEFKISDIWQQLSYRTKLRTTDLMALPLFFHLFLWWIFFFIFFTSSWIFWKDSSLIVCSIRHASWFAVSGDTLSVLRIQLNFWHLLYVWHDLFHNLLTQVHTESPKQSLCHLPTKVFCSWIIVLQNLTERFLDAGLFFSDIAWFDISTQCSYEENSHSDKCRYHSHPD